MKRKGIIDCKAICTKCGNVRYLQRQINRQKKSGSTESMYCPNCDKETPHREERD